MQKTIQTGLVPIGAEMNPDIKPNITFGYDFILDLMGPVDSGANIK